jgi:hypothetical protein
MVPGKEAAMTHPTAAALVEEVRQHIVMLLLDPAPLEKAPHFFLDYWCQILQRIQALLAPEA